MSTTVTTMQTEKSTKKIRSNTKPRPRVRVMHDDSEPDEPKVAITAEVGDEDQQQSGLPSPPAQPIIHEEEEVEEKTAEPTTDEFQTEFLEKASVKRARYLLNLPPNELLELFPNTETIHRHRKQKKPLTDKQLEKQQNQIKQNKIRAVHQICRQIILNDGEYFVNYVYQSNIKGVRLQAKDLSIFKNMDEEIKCFLGAGIYKTDLDIVNSYPSILLALLKNLHTEGDESMPDFNMLADFCKNRKQILKKHGLTKQQVLAFMLMDKVKMKEDGKDGDYVTNNMWLFKFNLQLYDIKQYLWNLPEKDKKKKKQMQQKAQANADNREQGNPYSSYMAFKINEMENKFLHKALAFFPEDAAIILCYDGIMSDHEITDDDLKIINERFAADGIQWAKKPLECDVDLPEDFDEEECMDYYSIKKRYEKSKAWIDDIAGVVFVDEYNCGGTLRKEIKLRRHNQEQICQQNVFPSDYCSIPPRSFYDLWSVDPHRRSYTRMEYEPRSPLQSMTCDDEKTFNRFMGFPIDYDPHFQPGPCTEFHDLLLHLCNGNEAYAMEIKKFYAHMVQKPNENPQWGVILAGRAGSGKSSLIRVAQILVGEDNYSETPNVDQLFPDGNKDNSMLKDKIVVACEEIKGKRAGTVDYIIRQFITSPYVNIKELYISPYKLRNYVRLIMLSNHGRVIPMNEQNARRFMYLKVTETMPQGLIDRLYTNEDAFFNCEEKQSTLYHELMQMDITDFRVGKAPETEDKDGASQSEIPPLELFFALLFELGTCFTKSLQKQDEPDMWFSQVSQGELVWQCNEGRLFHCLQTWLCQENYNFDVNRQKFRRLIGKTLKTGIDGVRWDRTTRLKQQPGKDYYVIVEDWEKAHKWVESHLNFSQ